jgi:hypothetical protein
MNAKDSAAFMIEKGKVLNETVVAFENSFLEQHKGTFVGRCWIKNGERS